ncbi:hypothetical protein [uncultured Corynebacterium sp.]|uniref:hypothetical protein n=1 Tax=uncultured Corynebacterium sp. TaxID=159447 RepID=UPI00259B8268|nr:hypothetical protein [uncultured Corynebacterium sp.]
MNRTLRAATVAAAILAVPAVNATAQDLPAHEVAQTPAADPVAEDALGVGDVESTGDAPVASGLVEFPPVLTLDGTTYYLNKDGHTFVTDIERVDADVTPEEIAASEALISANAGEIGRQGLEAARAAGEADAEAEAEAPAETPAEAPAETPAQTQYAATTRGLEAETGSNTLVRGVFALLLASALGAAFFAFARRRLI